MASANADGAIKLWDLDNFQLAVNIEHGSEVGSIVFTMDAEFIFVGERSGIIKLMDWKNSRVVKTFVGHKDLILSQAVSPDGEHLISGGCDNTVRLWEITTGRQINLFSEHTSWITSVAFRFDSKMFASGSMDNTIKVGQIDQKELLHTFSIKSRVKAFKSISFSPDGNIVACSCGDNTVRLCHLLGEKPVKTLRSYAEGLVYQVTYDAVNNALISGSHEGFIKWYEIKNYKPVKFVSNVDWIEYLTVSPNGKYLAICSTREIKIMKI